MLGEGVDDVWPAVARGEAVIVSSSFSHNFGVRTGDRLTLATPNGALSVLVGGMTSAFASPNGTIEMSRALFERYWNDASVTRVHVRVTPDAERVVRERIGERFRQRYRFRMLSAGELLQYWTDQVRAAFAGLHVIGAVVLVVVLIGMADTLTASIVERTRELGMVRAVGMPRAGVAAMVLAEALVLGLVGTTLAVLLGLLEGWVWVSATLPLLLRMDVDPGGTVRPDVAGLRRDAPGLPALRAAARTCGRAPRALPQRYATVTRRERAVVAGLVPAGRLVGAATGPRLRSKIISQLTPGPNAIIKPKPSVCSACIPRSQRSRTKSDVADDMLPHSCQTSQEWSSAPRGRAKQCSTASRTRGPPGCTNQKAMSSAESPYGWRKPSTRRGRLSWTRDGMLRDNTSRKPVAALSCIPTRSALPLSSTERLATISGPLGGAAEASTAAAAPSPNRTLAMRSVRDGGGSADRASGISTLTTNAGHRRHSPDQVGSRGERADAARATELRDPNAANAGAQSQALDQVGIERRRHVARAGHGYERGDGIGRDTRCGQGPPGDVLAQRQRMRDVELCALLDRTERAKLRQRRNRVAAADVGAVDDAAKSSRRRR
jgi:hypothetical protein